VREVSPSRFTGGTDEGQAAMIGQEPIGRMGRPEEVASAMLWLCSLGGFTVGRALVVEGARPSVCDGGDHLLAVPVHEIVASSPTMTMSRPPEVTCHRTGNGNHVRRGSLAASGARLPLRR
jgi:hypothetical protein